MKSDSRPRCKIAVIGTGISGLSAAWLLAERHDVAMYEKAPRLGGHSNTVTVDTEFGRIPVDTGFIVFNPVNYPNLVSLFRHLDVETKSSNMSFAVSLGDGAFEYGGNGLVSVFAQKRNLFSVRHWSMLRGILRFYREAPRDLRHLAHSGMTLGEYLASRNFGDAFIADHLLPMAGAIWSAPPKAMLDYPAVSFIRFFENHGLLKLRDRPVWRTVVDGSRSYVDKLAKRLRGRIRLRCGAVAVQRNAKGLVVRDERGVSESYDHVVIGTHADEALSLLADPTPEERGLLGAFQYSRNVTVLHSDARLMPRRRAVWSSWNYLGSIGDAGTSLAVTYWMNRLQGIDHPANFFVTLNPSTEPRADLTHWRGVYEHPIFDETALRAQQRLETLQGKRNTWYCGAYFGSGFHEDGLRSGLAVAEALGDVSRPWARTERAAAPDAPRLGELVS